MSENNIMKMATEHLAQAEEAFNRLGISKEIEAAMESRQVIAIVDRAYEACVAVLQEMTSKAPHVLTEAAEKNLESFQNGKETFTLDFKANFKRVVGVPLFYHLQMSGNAEEMKKNMLLSLKDSDSIEIQKVAKEIVDQMIIDITKDYLLTTYGNIIPAEILSV